MRRPRPISVGLLNEALAYCRVYGEGERTAMSMRVLQLLLSNGEMSAAQVGSAVGCDRKYVLKVRKWVAAEKFSNLAGARFAKQSLLNEEDKRLLKAKLLTEQLFAKDIADWYEKRHRGSTVGVSTACSWCQMLGMPIRASRKKRLSKRAMNGRKALHLSADEIRVLRQRWRKERGIDNLPFDDSVPSQRQFLERPDLRIKAVLRYGTEDVTMSKLSKELETDVGRWVRLYIKEKGNLDKLCEVHRKAARLRRRLNPLAR